MRKFGLIVALVLTAATLSACSGACPGGGTWCQNQPPQGGDGSAGAEKPKAPATKVVAPVVKH